MCTPRTLLGHLAAALLAIGLLLRVTLRGALGNGGPPVELEHGGAMTGEVFPRPPLPQPDLSLNPNAVITA